MLDRNGLLANMSASDQSLIAPFLEPISFRNGDLLFEADRPIEHVHFLVSGLSSEIVTSDGNQERVEVGCVGHEGLSGHAILLGADMTPHHSFMQIDGEALRIETSALLRMMDESASLRLGLLRYVHVFGIQIAASALSDARFTIPQRLARWLLMVSDRVGDEMVLTHEYLALMLGVRRSGVTNEIHVLEGEHLIKASRGRIRLLNREGLLAIAAGCYGKPEAEYMRLIGDPVRRQ